MARKQEMRVTQITKTELESLLTHWLRFAKCYFWSSPATVSGRRSEEKRSSREVEFQVNGEPVVVKIEIDCTCKNYYCRRSVRVNGDKKAQGATYLKGLIEHGIFEETRIAREETTNTP